MQPDIIFLSSPHAISHQRDFLIYQNTNASGYALVGGDLHNASHEDYKVPMKVGLADSTVGLRMMRVCELIGNCAANLLQALKKQNLNVSGSFFAVELSPTHSTFVYGQD